MLFNLLKLHKFVLVFLVESMMSYTDSLDVLFKSIHRYLVATSPILNKASKLWCLPIPNLVQKILVNDQFIFVTCLLHDKCFSFAGVYGANTYLLDDFCGGILVSSQDLGVFWKILMLYSWLMTAKGGDS